MSEAEEWTRYIAELRQIAEQAVDAGRQQKLFDLVGRWEEFAEDLGRDTAPPAKAA
jgi:hypothetical protein